MIWQITCILLLLPGILATGYYLVLALVAVGAKNRYKSIKDVKQKQWRFAIVIPAYNEEKTIRATLESCQSLDYPEGLYDVYVIADNCTDKTAQISSLHGAIPLIRNDQSRRGKGYALSWGFKNIFSNGHDAFVVLDADCLIDSHALKAFAHHLSEGKLVLQANDISSNPDDSPMSYAVSVGNILENDFFYDPKSRLGLAVLLRGTGMVLTREILAEYPWEAGSIVEDMEYSLRLFRSGVRTHFVKEARVASPFPIDRRQLDIQRTRWASGNLGFGKSDAFKLLWEGITLHNILLLDAGITLLTISRPLVLLEIMVTIAACSISTIIVPGTISNWCIGVAVTLLLIQIFYLGLGILHLGLSRKRLKCLIFTPLVVLRLVTISIIGLLGVNRDQWTKTPREQQKDQA